MKRILLLLAALALLFASCSGQEEKTSQTETEEDAPFYHELTKKPEYPEDLTPYLRLPEDLTVTAKFDDPELCTDEEVDEAVFQVMLTYAAFSLEQEREAQLYDRVELDYVASIDGEVQEDLSESGATLVIGKSGNSLIETVLADAVLGKKAGESATVEYTYPADSYYYNSYAGKTVVFDVQVTGVCFPNVPLCDEEFVQGLPDYNFNTVEEFRESVRADLMEEKRSAKLSVVWNEFVKKVEILSYPEKALEWHEKAYENEVLQTVYQYNETLESFAAKFLNQTMPEYEAERLKYAEEQVKNEMIFMALVQKLEISLSEEEYQNALTNYFDHAEYDGTIEEFEAEYGREYFEEIGCWDKAVETLMEMAVREE